VKGAVQQIGSAHHAQERFFFSAGKGPFLHDLEF
jgi:hypothetical protein